MLKSPLSPNENRDFFDKLRGSHWEPLFDNTKPQGEEK